MGVVEWQPCVAFDLVVPLGMQAPGAVCGYADGCRVAHALLVGDGVGTMPGRAT